MQPRNNKFLQTFLVIAVFVIVVTVWQTLVNLLDVPSYILPAPSEIAKSLIKLLHTYSFLVDICITVQEAFWGYLVSILIALVLGVLISQFYILELSCLPYVVAFQTVPSIALAPIYLTWFGYGMASKIALAVTIACFPIMISVISGLQATNIEQIQMLRAFGANRFQVLTKVQIPNALPHFFTGLKLGVVMSLTGALVAEFVSAKAGMGSRILEFTSFRTADMFAVLVILGVIGVLAHGGISWLKRKIVFWDDAFDMIEILPSFAARG